MREFPAIWLCLLVSVAFHAAVAAATMLATPVTPPRPVAVRIGVTSFASSASLPGAKNEPVVKLPEPKKREEQEIAPPPVKVEKDEEPKLKEVAKAELPRPVTPRVPPPPPIAKNVGSGTVASVASQASTGAQADALPERAPTNPAPPYPAEAERNGWEGRVVLRVMVLKDGRAGAVSVHKSSGHDVLDRAARDTVQTWQFIPGRRGNVAIDFEIGVPVDFRLKSDALRVLQ